MLSTARWMGQRLLGEHEVSQSTFYEEVLMMGERKGDVLLVSWADADAAELALETDAVGVVGRGGLREEGGTTLGLGVFVVILVV